MKEEGRREKGDEGIAGLSLFFPLPSPFSPHVLDSRQSKPDAVRDAGVSLEPLKNIFGGRSSGLRIGRCGYPPASAGSRLYGTRQGGDCFFIDE